MPAERGRGLGVAARGEKQVLVSPGGAESQLGPRVLLQASLGWHAKREAMVRPSDAL